ncbi:uncharacterized protein [Euphorbia lathyris]|uniref:uncharacterized protein isoform X2 n=1 Tax=Euphorbia lathyris TaxID=212925 RepID=UPI003313EDC1
MLSLVLSPFPFPFPLPFKRVTHWLSFPYPQADSNITYRKRNLLLLHASSSSSESESEEYHVLSAIKSEYNDILILDTPNARMLLLDSTHAVHSILNKDHHKWTGSYWDEFTTLPPIIPKGPIAILGLGGGTAAHLMLSLWPSLHLEGWEIDPILIDKARQHFGLSELEKHNTAGGILHIHIRDALSSSGNDSGRYAGKILPQLQEVATWLKLNDRLMAGGRFMVNCGGVYETSSPKSVDENWVNNSTLKALSEAFPGQVSWKRLPETQGANYLALTGPFPDLTLWSTNVPPHPFPLSENVRKWKPCATFP